MTRFSSWLVSGLLVGATFGSGCGDIEETPPDAAPQPDADLSPDAAVAGVVTVTIGDGIGGPEPFPADVPVLFFGPDGALVAEEMTDAQGVAAAETLAGSTVVALIPTPPPPAPTGAPSLKVVLVAAGVGPGDSVLLGRMVMPPAETLGNMTFHFPGEPPAGTVNYVFHPGCGNPQVAAPQIVFEVTSRCTSGDNLDVLVEALDGGGNTLGYTWDQVPFAVDGEVTLDGEWVDPDTFAVVSNSLPAGVRDAEDAVIASVIGRRSFDQVNFSVDSKGPAVALPPSAFGGTRPFKVTFESSQFAVSPQLYFEHLPATASSVDMADLALLSFFGAPLYSPGDRSLMWTRTSGDSPDAIDGVAQWLTEDAQGAVYFRAPPGADALVLPRLPMEYEPYLPADLEVGYAVMLAMEYSWHPGYSEAIQVEGHALLGVNTGVELGDRVRLAISQAEGGILRTSQTNPKLPKAVRSLLRVSEP